MIQLACAWITGCALLELASFEPQLSRVGVLLAAWIVWAGLPRLELARPGVVGTGWRGAWIQAVLWIALLLPPLALALRLDELAGCPRSALLQAAVWGLVFCWLQALAAERALRAGGSKGRSWYAGVWLVFVFGIPVFARALAAGGGSGGDSLGGAALEAPAGLAALEWLASASPLVWALEQAARAPHELPDTLAGLRRALAPLAVLALLLAIGGRRGSEVLGESVS